MKRFYCTTCKKPKRIRLMPKNVNENLNPKEQGGLILVGICRSHNREFSRNVINSRARKSRLNVKKHRISAGQQKSKSKK